MIGIFGGTFDPIHFGHLRVALDVQEALGLSDIRFIPLNNAVHREQPVASAEQRLEMVQLAIESQQKFILDDREIRHLKPSYTVTTLKSLRQDYPQETFCLLVGSDAFNGFPDWHQPEQILELAHLIVMQRPGHQLPDVSVLRQLTAERQVEDQRILSESTAGKIFFQDVTQLSISSSDIRQRLVAGGRISYLLPDSVMNYIDRHQLYAAK